MGNKASVAVPTYDIEGASLEANPENTTTTTSTTIDVEAKKQELSQMGRLMLDKTLKDSIKKLEQDIKEATITNRSSSLHEYIETYKRHKNNAVNLGFNIALMEEFMELIDSKEFIATQYTEFTKKYNLTYNSWLYAAILQKKINVVEFLLHIACDRQKLCKYNGYSHLGYALDKSSIDIIRLLMKRYYGNNLEISEKLNDFVSRHINTDDPQQLRDVEEILTIYKTNTKQ